MNERKLVLERQMRLQNFVESYVGKPCEWGQSDCTSWCAAWIEEWTGKPFARASYSSKHQASKIIAEHGSLINLWEYTMRENGIAESFSPSIGDVGLVDGQEGVVGTIFLHGGYCAIRGEIGATIILPRVLHRVWSI